jgi:hypothetical protein
MILNEELGNIMQDIDIVQLFRTIRKGKAKNSNSDSVT